MSSISTVEDGNSGNSVGRRLRSHRHEQGLTLEQLSDRSGLSTGFLSQVERGKSSLSLISLQHICGALGLSARDLLPGAEGLQVGWGDSELVHGPHQRLAIAIAGIPVSYHYLSASFPGRVLEVLILQIPSNYVHPITSHEGEEFGYVLEGAITIHISEKEFKLSEEHTYHIPSRAKFSYRTEPGMKARILTVTTGRILDQLRQNL